MRAPGFPGGISRAVILWLELCVFSAFSRATRGQTSHGLREVQSCTWEQPPTAAAARVCVAHSVLRGGNLAPSTSCSDGHFGSTLIQNRLQIRSHDGFSDGAAPDKRHVDGVEGRTSAKHGSCPSRRPPIRGLLSEVYTDGEGAGRSGYGSSRSRIGSGGSSGCRGFSSGGCRGCGRGQGQGGSRGGGRTRSIPNGSDAQACGSSRINVRGGVLRCSPGCIRWSMR